MHIRVHPLLDHSLFLFPPIESHKQKFVVNADFRHSFKKLLTGFLCQFFRWLVVSMKILSAATIFYRGSVIAIDVFLLRLKMCHNFNATRSGVWTNGSVLAI